MTAVEGQPAGEQGEHKAAARKKRHGVLTKQPKGRPLTSKDALFSIVGIARSNVPGGFSWRKHELGI